MILMRQEDVDEDDSDNEKKTCHKIDLEFK